MDKMAATVIIMTAVPRMIGWAASTNSDEVRTRTVTTTKGSDGDGDDGRVGDGDDSHDGNYDVDGDDGHYSDGEGEAMNRRHSGRRVVCVGRMVVDDWTTVVSGAPHRGAAVQRQSWQRPEAR